MNIFGWHFHKWTVVIRPVDARDYLKQEHQYNNIYRFCSCGDWQVLRVDWTNSEWTITTRPDDWNILVRQ